MKKKALLFDRENKKFLAPKRLRNVLADIEAIRSDNFILIDNEESVYFDGLA